MKQTQAVFIGDVAVDEYYQADVYPQLREKIGVDMLPPQMGGTIANAACVYAALGNPTRFVSVLNRHDCFLCDDLEQNGIDTGMVVWDDALPDSKCVILLAEGEHTVLIVRRPYERLELPPATQAALCGAGVIYSNFNELRPLRCGEKDAVTLAAEWKAAGARLVCDLDVADMAPEALAFLPYTHTLFVNEIGFRNLSAGRAEAETVQSVLDAGVELLVVTLAERGCVIHSRQGRIDIEGVPVQPVDVTGAGDTFCAAFTHLYTLCGNAALAGRFANYAAARSILQLGARGGVTGAGPVLNFMAAKGHNPAPYAEYLQGENV